MRYLILLACAFALPPLLLLEYYPEAAMVVLTLYASTVLAWIVAGYLDYQDMIEEEDE